MGASIWAPGSTITIDSASLLALFQLRGGYCGAASGVDTIVLTPSTPLAAYAAGQEFTWISAGANTGPATVNISGLGPVALTKENAVALAANDVPGVTICTGVFDGTRIVLTEVASVNKSLFTVAGDSVISTAAGVPARIPATADVAAHATTMNPWVARNIVLTGAIVTFTALANAPYIGAVAWIKMNDAHIWTNGATFRMPGLANYTAAADDWFRIEAVTLSTFSVAIFKADGTAVAVAAASETAFSMETLYGCTLSNNVADATNDIDITTGKRRDILDSTNISLSTALTKQLDAAWALGSAAGFRDTGSIANGTWHIHVIKRADTGVVDAIASLSPDTNSVVTITIATPGVVTWTDHGLVAGASISFTTSGALPTGIVPGTVYFVIATGLTANTFQFSATQGGVAIDTTGTQSGVHTGQAQPVLPANYTHFRRIGSILRESATIVGFVQDGNDFWRKGVFESFDAVVAPITAVTRTLAVPVGIRVKAIFSSSHQNNGAAFAMTYFSDLSLTDAAPVISAIPGASVGYSTSDTIVAGGPFNIWTNKSAGIRSRNSQANDTLRIYTLGWIDPRGVNK